MSLDFRDVVDELRAQGSTVEQLNASHYQARPPHASGAIVHFADSSGDHRAIRNTIAQLRRSGFRWREGEDEAPTSERTCATCAGTREIAGRGVRVPCPDCVVLAPPDPPPLVTGTESTGGFFPSDPAEDPLDHAYRDLREARAYLGLAEGHAAETTTALAEAQRRRDDAAAELGRAAEAFEASERAFLAALRSRDGDRT